MSVHAFGGTVSQFVFIPSEIRIRYLNPLMRMPFIRRFGGCTIPLPRMYRRLGKYPLLKELSGQALLTTVCASICYHYCEST